VKLRFTLLLAGLLLSGATTLADAQIWQGTSGTLYLGINPTLPDGLRIESVGQKRDGRVMRHLFQMDSSLRFEGRPNGMRHLLDGAVESKSALHLETPSETIHLTRLRLEAVGGTHDFRLVDTNGAVLFTLSQSHTWMDTETSALSFRDMDVRISKGFALRLGEPRFAGHTIGVAHLDLATDRPHGFVADKGGVCPTPEELEVLDPGQTLPVDVELTNVSTFSQWVRSGGRVAATPDAHLKNVGNNHVRWYRAISPDGSPLGSHPFLAMSAYRIVDDEITQIGRSDVKHAFFTTNFGVDCDCPGAQILYLGCEDVYGTFNNTDRFYLAPRDEVQISTGDWTSQGSHFDGSPVDDSRDHTSSGHDDFEHRLVMDESDLTTPGAEYFSETWYPIKNDIDIFNSMGWRQLDPELSGSTWTFTPFLTSLVHGPVIDHYVDPDNPAPGRGSQTVTTPDGRLRVAVRTADLGGGQYRYNYAIMNLDYDTGIESFSVPAPPNTQTGDTGFADGDSTATDWDVNIAGGMVTWTAPSASEVLTWGVLYSFSLIANDLPDPSSLVLTPPGSGDLTVTLLAPNGTIFADSFED